MQATRRSAHCVDSNRVKWHTFTPPVPIAMKVFLPCKLTHFFFDSFASKDVSVAAAVA